mgnify:FL=1
MEHKVYFSDYHSNIHSNQLDDLDRWYDFARDMLDFWAPVYYPFFINENAAGFHFEDTWPPARYDEDFSRLCRYLEEKKDGFVTFPAYEWQGSGADGDHNVFFKHYDSRMKMPLTYRELVEQLRPAECIGIPHHTGYMPGHRGKNWATNDEAFSPVMEIYSSHGCSESSDCAIPLNVHIHMGPRTEQGTALYAIRQGIKVGFIASGDNHVCPAIAGNGFFGVVAGRYDRDEIYSAIQNRHTYAVTRSRMLLDYQVNGAILGSEIPSRGENRLRAEVVAGQAVDRIELYQNGVVARVYTHAGTYERTRHTGPVTFKFELEAGWGPDRRNFPDICQKTWDIQVKTRGRIESVEKLWTSPGSAILTQSEGCLSMRVVSRKDLPGQGKLSQKNYFSPNIQNQSVIVEITDDIRHSIEVWIDGVRQEIPIARLLEESVLFAQEQEARQLLEERFGFGEYYREDPFWHNAYKVLVHRACPKEAYHMTVEDVLPPLEREEDSFFIKVLLKNGEAGWASPIWIKA